MRFPRLRAKRLRYVVQADDTLEELVRLEKQGLMVVAPKIDPSMRPFVKMLQAEMMGEVRMALAVERSQSWFEWLEMFVPKRLSEDIGDALEVINRIASDPDCLHPRAMIWAKCISTTFWVFINLIRYVTSSVLGKKAE
jgi:hypothetical protein